MDYKSVSDWDSTYLNQIAEKHGTPLYVTDVERVEENYTRLREAFGRDTNIFYAMKANASQSVLKTLLPYVDGFECGSIGEVERALYALEGSQEETTIQYTTTNQKTESLQLFTELMDEYPENRYIVTLNDIRTAYRLIGNGYTGDICLRINPGIGVGHHDKVKTGKDAKFGILPEDIDNAVTVIEESPATLVGIHAHAGSGILEDDKEQYLEMVNNILSFAADVNSQLASDSTLEFVDIGGGIGVPYHPSDTPLDVEEIAEEIKTKKYDYINSATLQIEPGRYLVADASVLLTQVTTTKQAEETTIVGVDSGMTTLIRPALYDAYHPATVVTDEERKERQTTLAGPICESSDVFFTERDFPTCTENDIIVIGNTGAYGYEMASVFHSQPRPKTLITDGETQTKIERKRETIEDICQHETGATF